MARRFQSIVIDVFRGCGGGKRLRSFAGLIVKQCSRCVSHALCGNGHERRVGQAYALAWRRQSFLPARVTAHRYGSARYRRRLMPCHVFPTGQLSSKHQKKEARPINGSLSRAALPLARALAHLSAPAPADRDRRRDLWQSHFSWADPDQQPSTPIPAFNNACW